MSWFKKKVRDPHMMISYAFNESMQPFNLHWTERAQPDLGGARNYSWDARQDPLRDICGTAVVVPPINPIGSPPLAPVQQWVETGAGRWSGQIFHAPLIDVSIGNQSGYDGFPGFAGY